MIFESVCKYFLDIIPFTYVSQKSDWIDFGYGTKGDFIGITLYDIDDGIELNMRVESKYKNLECCEMSTYRYEDPDMLQNIQKELENYFGTK